MQMTVDWKLACVCILVVWNVVLVSCEDSYCRPINTSLLSHCGLLQPGNYLVRSDLKEERQDEMAFDESKAVIDCDFFDLQYNCMKYFPRCFNTSGKAEVQFLCSSFCEKAALSSESCKRYNMDYLCHDSYLGLNPNCFTFKRNPKSMDPGLIVMVSILSLIGVSLMGYIYYKKREARLWQERPDSLEFESERRERLKAEKAAKKRATEAEKIAKKRAISLGEQYAHLNDEETDIVPQAPQYRTAQQARLELMGRELSRGSQGERAGERTDSRGERAEHP